jgi:hypothetical protein
MSEKIQVYISYCNPDKKQKQPKTSNIEKKLEGI